MLNPDDPYAPVLDWIDGGSLTWRQWKAAGHGGGPLSWLYWAFGDHDEREIRHAVHVEMIENGTAHIYLGNYYPA